MPLQPNNLNGMTYAQRTAIGTSNVVTAVANTKGIYIARAMVAAIISGSQASVLVGGNLLLFTAASGVASVNRIDSVENYLIPAGVALDITISGSAEQAFIWYKVL